MQKPYLIQRLNFKEYSRSDGSFDNVLQCDYMGSSEFEWGALPDSLKLITKNFDSLKLNFFKKFKNYKDQALVIIANPDDAKLYFNDYIEKLAFNEIHLKEQSRFKEAVFGEDFRGQPINENSYVLVDAWWDIENDIIFTFSKKNAKRILKTIENTRDKKKAEGEKDWY